MYALFDSSREWICRSLELDPCGDTGGASISWESQINLSKWCIFVILLMFSLTVALQAHVSRNPTKEQLVNAIQQHFSSQVCMYTHTHTHTIKRVSSQSQSWRKWRNVTCCHCEYNTACGWGTSDCGFYPRGQEITTGWHKLSEIYASLPVIYMYVVTALLFTFN